MACGANLAGMPSRVNGHGGQALVAEAAIGTPLRRVGDIGSHRIRLLTNGNAVMAAGAVSIYNLAFLTILRQGSQRAMAAEAAGVSPKIAMGLVAYLHIGEDDELSQFL